MVHPSLDRLAFLIEPEGVRVHRLTDGAYERSGLAAGQHHRTSRRTDAARRPCRSSPRRGTASRSRSRATRSRSTLNGQAIYERTLEPTNRRAFGLFHYADATQARVRNVTYQGEWPRSLPGELRH